MEIVGDDVRKTLITVVKEKGSRVFDKPRELETLLNDLCHNKKRELSAIFPAIREKFSEKLLEACKLKKIDLVIEDLSNILCKDHALSSEAALWAVESVAIALGLTSEKELEEIYSSRDSGRRKEYEKTTSNRNILIRVAGGSFIMGNTWDNIEYVDLSNEIKEDLKRQMPAHRVSLTYDFYIGKYAVTFEEYDRFCEEIKIIKPCDQGWGRGKRPTIDVTWHEAIAYCNWLSDKEGLPRAYDNGGNLLDKNALETDNPSLAIGYRLPSEAEWEYAARGGKKSVGFRYAGANEADRVAWFLYNSCYKFNPKRPERALLSGKTQEVGLKAANELGLYDMSGNVWEWCSDLCAKYKNSPRTNPYQNEGAFRVARGGCWGSTKSGVTVAKRGGDLPTNKSSSLGFRLCITAI
ncbi:MAG: formylglycine-generating enzyme family protein [Thermotogaceae bacterium]|jgi:formylglycine-generating enzyme required for sulfatase activity|nr:formylglycine-generating enzyme family protein [Thermotogaceae bacterium]